MNRCAAAAILFAALIVGCFGNLLAVSRMVDDIMMPLDRAIAMAEEKDLDAARRLTEQAHDRYVSHEGYFSAVCSEKLLDEVRLCFARAQASAQAADAVQLLPELRALKQAIDDLLRTERFNAKNILYAVSPQENPAELQHSTGFNWFTGF